MHSRDLVHWRIVNYIYDTLADDDTYNLRNGRNAYGRGQWATTLRENNGTFYAGSPEPVCNGVFTFYDEQGHFDRINDSSLQVAAEHNGMGFCQVLAIFDGEIAYTDTLKQDFWIHKDYVFRALCEKDGKLCLIESCDKVSYARFVHYLKEYGVKYAINLDMGGWSHSWYRDNYGDVITTGSSPTKYASNWLLFKP